MTKNTHSAPARRVLLAGGYGLVGAQVARLLRRHHPHTEILLAGRTPARAEALAAELGNARAVALDTDTPQPLAGLGELDAVAALVHDQHDHLLRDCATRGVPYLDITRDADAQARAWVTAALVPLRAPVLFASNWMAGVPAVLARALAQDVARVESIELAILYYAADRMGPDSASAEGGLVEPVRARIGDKWSRVSALSDGRAVRFPSGLTRRVYRTHLADGLTLAQASGAADVAVRLGLDDTRSFGLMRVLMRSGLWSLMMRVPALRSALAQRPGPGAPHELVVSLRGRDEAGALVERRAGVLDPAGQSHLTSLGVLHGLERIAGLRGSAMAPGVAVPERGELESARLLELLRAEGVRVDLSGFEAREESVRSEAA